MSKLDPDLQHRLRVWQAKRGDSTARGSALGGERVAVVVTYVGALDPLRAAGLDTGYAQGGVVSGQIELADLDRLAAVPEVVYVVMEPPVRLALDGTVEEILVPWKVPPSDVWPGKGAGSIVAVIDTGIDIFHDSFRKSDGSTRILELWDQAASTGGSNPPAPFQQLGRVYDEDQINAGITAGPPFHSTDTNGHGTHVAGIAAGNGRQDDRCSFPGRYVGVAPEAGLVVVRAIALPAGSQSSTRDAMLWCAQAGARHGAKPVVINCSFGSQRGPHDGTGGSDPFVDEILRPASGVPAGIVIVCSAGNEGAKEMHEAGTVPANDSRQVQFYIPDRSFKDDRIDIWYDGTSSLDVTLTAPENPAQSPPNTTGPVSAPASAEEFTIGGMTIEVSSTDTPAANFNNKKHIVLTIGVDEENVSIRAGVWTLTLAETSGTAATWDAWVDSERGDAAPTFRLPSESGDPVARRREKTIGAPGTSLNSITVANYDDGTGELNPSSSRGPSPIPAGTPVGEVKPTIAAPGSGVAAPRSRDDPVTPSSCCDQLVIDKTGTSMSSPHIAGVVALMLEKNKTLTFEQVREHLQHSTRTTGIPAGEVPPVYDAAKNIRANHLWGSGKVSAAAALAEITAASGGGGGGGGGGGMIVLGEEEWGYTPHTIFSRLGEWRARFGPRPGLMLAAALVSRHVDEILRLINTNVRVGAVWKRNGGPLLVRHLLYSHRTHVTVLPDAVDGCDVRTLIDRLLPILDRFGGERLRADIAHYRDFVVHWPGADADALDAYAVQLGATA